MYRDDSSLFLSLQVPNVSHGCSYTLCARSLCKTQYSQPSLGTNRTKNTIKSFLVFGCGIGGELTLTEKQCCGDRWDIRRIQRFRGSHDSTSHSYHCFEAFVCAPCTFGNVKRPIRNTPLRSSQYFVTIASNFAKRMVYRLYRSRTITCRLREWMIPICTTV